MDDLEFRQRALANPRDDDPHFLAAADRDVGRRRQLDELQRFEDKLEEALRVDVPVTLKARLLSPSLLAQTAENDAPPSAPMKPRGLLARLLPAAACVAIAWGAALDVWQPHPDPVLEHEIFSHIYRELSYLGMDNVVTLDAVNRYMATLQGQLRPGEGPENIEIRVADDCWVAGSDTVHLVMEGDRGAVTVLLVRNTPVEREFPINDARFTGLVTPTRGGNLVVVGEKQERLGRYKRLISDRLVWGH